MTQLNIFDKTPDIEPFSTGSKINSDHLKGQNKTVFDHLNKGFVINTIVAQNMGITALNSRISDLRNRHNITIYDRFITTPNGVHVKEYSLNPFVKKV